MPESLLSLGILIIQLFDHHHHTRTDYNIYQRIKGRRCYAHRQLFIEGAHSIGKMQVGLNQLPDVIVNFQRNLVIIRRKFQCHE